MTQAHAIQMCSWEYDGKYAVYNLIPWEKMVEAGNFVLTNQFEREKQFRSFLTDNGELMVVCRHVIGEDGKITIGISTHPKHLSQGYGKIALIIFLKWLDETYPQAKIHLTVRTWNERAINCYKKAGFEIIETVIRKGNDGVPAEFYTMELRCIMQ